jgi:hypothetical protein
VPAGFRREHGGALERLGALAPEAFARTAYHPRLDQPVRLVDMLFFQAEHDDHHLARISDLERLFG